MQAAETTDQAILGQIAAIRALGDIAAHGQTAAPALLRILCSPERDPRLRAAAAIALGRFETQGRVTLPYLIQTSQLETPLTLKAPQSFDFERLRDAAAVAVIRLKLPTHDAVSALSDIVRNPALSDATRCEAISALVTLGPIAKNALPALGEAVYGSPALARAAVDAIAIIEASR
jgi:hypothetical protein